MRKIVLYGIICFQLLLIVSLIRGIQTSKKSAVRISNMEETRDKLIEEQNKLKKEGQYVASQFYLEKVARDELHLSRPGETVVIIPEGSTQGISKQDKPDTQVEEANWQKWWRVLSGQD